MATQKVAAVTSGMRGVSITSISSSAEAKEEGTGGTAGLGRDGYQGEAAAPTEEEIDEDDPLWKASSFGAVLSKFCFVLRNSCLPPTRMVGAAGAGMPSPSPPQKKKTPFLIFERASRRLENRSKLVQKILLSRDTRRPPSLVMRNITAHPLCLSYILE